MFTSIKKILPLILIFGLLTGMAVLPEETYAQKADRKNKTKTRKDNTSLFLEANSQKLLGNLDKARDLFLQCITLDPEDAASMYELARIERISGNQDEALDWARKAVKFSPENVWYLKLLSDLYQENMQFDESISVLNELVKLHPYKLDYLYDLALTHLLVGNYQKAINIYNQIEAKIGLTEEISIQKQKIWLRMDKPEKAINEMEALCVAWPDDSRLKSILAELYLSNGMDEKALSTYLEIAEE